MGKSLQKLLRLTRHTVFSIPVNISAAGLNPTDFPKKWLLLKLAWCLVHFFGLQQDSRSSLCSLLSGSTKQPLSLWFSAASKHASNFIPIQQNT